MLILYVRSECRLRNGVVHLLSLCVRKGGKGILMGCLVTKRAKLFYIRCLERAFQSFYISLERLPNTMKLKKI